MTLSRILIFSKKLLHYLLVSVLIVLIFITSCLCVDKFIIGNDIPSFMNYSILSVETGSMANTINEGDYIIIKKTEDYKIGDIITFKKDGDNIPTTHRIVLIENGEYITKGDFNNIKDFTPVLEDEIIGEVVLTIPYIGLFFRWAKTTEGIIFISCFVLSILAFYIVYKKGKYNDKIEQ